MAYRLSQTIEEAVQAFKKLPGIGEKTAMRLVLATLEQSSDDVEQFAQSLHNLKTKLKKCNVCHSFADDELCSICTDNKRDKMTLCVVESIRDIVAIESTQTYHGVYHVLGGLISPMQGIGPEDLTFSSLFHRIKSDQVKEVIMALNPNMEGDTTTFYISRQLDLESISLTSLSRGISFGGELEFADAMTLSRSLAARQPFDRYLSG